MATIFGQKKRWCKLRIMMTFMEVKGHQRSNGVNYVLGLPYLVNRSPDASWEWWWPWWRSKVIKGVTWGKLCAMATIFGQKKPWCKLRVMMTLIEVKGHQRSNGVNYVLWLPYGIWSKEVLIQTENDDDLYRGQRSSVVKCGKLQRVSIKMVHVEIHHFDQ